MKKTLIVAGLIAVLVLGSAFAFADSMAPAFSRNFRRVWNNAPLSEKEREGLAEENFKLYKENMEYKKEELKRALDNGEITQEEYNKWKEHFNYMEEFHNENGFFPGRGCHGVGMMRGFGRGMGMRRGSMGW